MCYGDHTHTHASVPRSPETRDGFCAVSTHFCGWRCAQQAGTQQRTPTKGKGQNKQVNRGRGIKSRAQSKGSTLSTGPVGNLQSKLTSPPPGPLCFLDSDDTGRRKGSPKPSPGCDGPPSPSRSRMSKIPTCKTFWVTGQELLKNVLDLGL